MNTFYIKYFPRNKEIFFSKNKYKSMRKIFHTRLSGTSFMTSRIGLEIKKKKKKKKVYSFSLCTKFKSWTFMRTF